MKITKIRLSHYKSIWWDENAITIEPNKINSFIWTNNAWKSNILKWFVLFFDILKTFVKHSTIACNSMILNERISEELFHQKNPEHTIQCGIECDIPPTQYKNFERNVVSYMPADERLDAITINHIKIDCMIFMRKDKEYVAGLQKIVVWNTDDGVYHELIALGDTEYKLFDEIIAWYKANQPQTEMITQLTTLLDKAKQVDQTSDTEEKKKENTLAILSSLITKNETTQRVYDLYENERRIGEANDTIQQKIEEYKNQRAIKLSKSTVTFLWERISEIPHVIFALLDYIQETNNVIYIQEKRSIHSNDVQWAKDLVLSPYAHDQQRLTTLKDLFGKIIYQKNSNGQPQPSEIQPVQNPDIKDDMYFMIDGHRAELNGTWSQQLIKILTTILQQKKASNNIICIEEPETHIHAWLEKKFFRMIKDDFHSDNDVWISLLTTHSTNFAEIYNHNTNVYLTKKDFATQTTQIDLIDRETEESVATELWIGLESYLFKKLVIFVEGKTDEEFLLEVSERLGTRIDNYNIGIYTMDGHRSLRSYYKSAQKIFAGKDISMMFVIDRDEKTDQEREKLQQDIPDLIMLERNEIENYFLDENLILYKEALCRHIQDDEKQQQIQEYFESKKHIDTLWSAIYQPSMQEFLNNVYKNHQKKIYLHEMEEARKNYTIDDTWSFDKKTTIDQVQKQFKIWSEHFRDLKEIYGDINKKIDHLLELLQNETIRRTNPDPAWMIKWFPGKELIKRLHAKVISDLDLWESVHIPKKVWHFFYDSITKDTIDPEIQDLIAKAVSIAA